METPEKTYSTHRRSDGSEVTNKRAASEAAMGDDVFDFDDSCNASNAAAPIVQYQPFNANSGYIYCRPWEWTSTSNCSWEWTSTSKNNKKSRKRKAKMASASDYLSPELFGFLSSFLPKVDNLVLALKGADQNSDYYKAAIDQIQKVAAKKLVFDTLLHMARPVTFTQL